MSFLARVTDRLSYANGSAKFRAAVLPAAVLLILLIVLILPGADLPPQGTRVRVLRTPGLSSALLLEQSGGTIVSAWLRNLSGSHAVENLEGLSYVSNATFTSKADNDFKEDILWRTSFMNFEGRGTHLWIGALSKTGETFIVSTPFHYTRWDAVPAKIIVPKGTALYVSPEAPSYGSSDGVGGKESYTFVYTVRLTPNGPAFVPVPDVYKQLAVLLQAGMRGEVNSEKKIAYLRMLNEFNSLAEGNPPRSETLLNFLNHRTDVLGKNKTNPEE